MGVGSGIGVDLVESENVPKQIDFSLSFGEEKNTEPILIQELTCGQNTMLLRDHKNRIFKTGLKLDYTPKLVRFNEELLKNDNVTQIACGRRHYVVMDKDQNAHVVGKVFNAKNLDYHDGFNVYDADQLFDGGRVTQLSMQYEIYGAVVEHNN